MVDYPYTYSGMDPWNLVLLAEARSEMYRQIIESLGNQQ